VHNYEQNSLILTNYKLSKMSFRIAFSSRQSYIVISLHITHYKQLPFNIISVALQLLPPLSLIIRHIFFSVHLSIDRCERSMNSANTYYSMNIAISHSHCWIQRVCGHYERLKFMYVYNQTGRAC